MYKRGAWVTSWKRRYFTAERDGESLTMKYHPHTATTTAAAAATAAATAAAAVATLSAVAAAAATRHPHDPPPSISYYANEQIAKDSPQKKLGE